MKETPETYFRRCALELGQSAHDPQAVARWCYYNPQKRIVLNFLALLAGFVAMTIIALLA